MTAARATSPLLERAATAPVIALALGALQATVGVVAVAHDTFLNNEGIFSYLFGGMVLDDPLPTLFLLKSRPPIATFYALPAAAGFGAFAVVHTLVAAASVPLVAVLARAAGHRRPNVPAALVAGSSMLIAAGASGVGNSDATTLGLLAAALLFAWDRPALAGLASSLLPLARAEMSLLVVALAVAAAAAPPRTRWRFFAGLVAPALAYALLGAVYHQDAIWFAHYPPHVSHTVPYSVIMGRQMFGGEPHMATLTLLTLTPAVGLLVFLRPSTLSRAEVVLGGFLVVFLAILMILPGLHPLNFGDMPRYVLPVTPYLALLVSRALESLAMPSPRSWTFGLVALAVLLVIAHVQDARHDAPALLAGVAGWSLVALVASTPWRRGVPALAVVLSVLAAVPLAGGTRLVLRPEVPALGGHLLDHASRGTVVLTNSPELPLWLARNGGGHLDVRHLQAADQRYELDTLANESVGQEEALRRLLREHWYGPIVFAEEVEALLVPGTWLALRDDARTSHLFDGAALEARSEVIPLGRARVLRVVAR